MVERETEGTVDGSRVEEEYEVRVAELHRTHPPLPTFYQSSTCGSYSGVFRNVNIKIIKYAALPFSFLPSDSSVF